LALKLATYRDGSRDGQLLVVSRDLGLAHYATGIANRLQQVLDDWDFLAPQLHALYVQLNTGKAPHAFPFDPRQCMAPLPRAYHYVQAAAYLVAQERQYKLHQQALPATFYSEPQLRSSAGDTFLGPCDEVVAPSESMEIDLAAGLAVITGDIPRGSTPTQALGTIRLLMLTGDVVLRQLEQATAPAGSLHSHLATVCSPVAATPDELGAAWQDGRAHLTLQLACNGRKLGLCNTGPAMQFHFGQLLAHSCKTRPWQAGAVLGSGCISPLGETDPQGQIHWPQGACSIADKRAIETLHQGRKRTPFLRYGDTMHADIKGKDGHSLFGALEPTIAPAQET